jgi:hypothetical protein
MSKQLSEQQNASPERIISCYEFFWGEVVAVGDGWVRAKLFDNRRFPDGDISAKAFCPGNKLIKGDRGLFLYEHNRPVQGYAFIPATHVDFGDVVNGEVTGVNKYGAEIKLSSPEWVIHQVVSDIRAILPKSDYALNDDNSVEVPKVGDSLKMVVKCVDAHKMKLVYVSLRRHVLRLADVQAAFNNGYLVQILKSESNSRGKKKIEVIEA